MQGDVGSGGCSVQTLCAMIAGRYTSRFGTFRVCFAKCRVMEDGPVVGVECHVHSLIGYSAPSEQLLDVIISVIIHRANCCNTDQQE